MCSIQQILIECFSLVLYVNASYSNVFHRNIQISIQQKSKCSRRNSTIDVLTGENKRLSRRGFGAGMFSFITVMSGVQCNPSQAHAACLSGDTSEDCIGVYKVPIDDEILPYIDTKEKLLRYAPDVKWLPPIKSPETIDEAKRTITEDYKKCKDQIESLIIRGDLVSAGKLVLEVMPRVTVSGQLIADDLFEKEKGSSEKSLKYLRLEAAFDELVIALGQFDVTLGQGLRGELGGITVTQLAILPDAKELLTKFSDFVIVCTE